MSRFYLSFLTKQTHEKKININLDLNLLTSEMKRNSNVTIEQIVNFTGHEKQCLFTTVLLVVSIASTCNSYKGGWGFGGGKQIEFQAERAPSFSKIAIENRHVPAFFVPPVNTLPTNSNSSHLLQLLPRISLSCTLETSSLTRVHNPSCRLKYRHWFWYLLFYLLFLILCRIQYHFKAKTRRKKPTPSSTIPIIPRPNPPLPVPRLSKIHITFLTVVMAGRNHIYSPKIKQLTERDDSLNDNP